MGNFLAKLAKNSNVPEIIFGEIKKGSSQDEIVAIIAKEIRDAIAQNGYSNELWTDLIIEDLSLILFNMYKVKCN